MRSSAVGGRRRRAVVLPLVAVLAAVGLTACNSSSHAATTVVPPPPGCDTARVTIVGASLDLSGRGAAIGKEELTGLELGIAKVNAGGGVWPHNSCLELEYKDNRGTAAVDTQAMEDLVNAEKATVVVGDFLGSTTESYLGTLGVPAISLSSLGTLFAPRRYPDTFPMTASTTSEASVMATSLKKEKVPTVGLVVTGDAASRQGAARLVRASSADGFTVVARAAVAPSGAGAGAALARLRAAHPGVVVVMDDAGAAGAVLAARARMGWSVPVLAGPDVTEAPVLSRAGGAAALAGVSAVVPVGAVRASGPAAAPALHFRSTLLARLGTGTLRGSIIPYAEAYDAMTMMGNAVNGAKGNSATDVTSFLQNANYQGVLANYTYTTAAHTGVDATDQVVVPVSGLSDGLLGRPL